MSNIVLFRRRNTLRPAARGGTPPPRVPNLRRRSREHLTAAEVARLTTRPVASDGTVVATRR
jgi:hypothetical protein